MRKLAVFVLTFTLLFALGSAQEAFIVTELNYADATVASVAASKVGAPVFFTPRDSLPQEILDVLAANNITTVYIIGGPAVISENVEQQLIDNNYTVIRIWGMTRFGTSAEVAKYFWPEGSDKAIIVIDLPDEAANDINYATLVAKAAEMAYDDLVPLLLNPQDKLSSEILETLQALNVTEVKLVGNFSLRVEEELINSNISIDEVVKGPIESIEEIIEQKIVSRPTRLMPLVIAAVGNWQDVLYAKATPMGVSLLVRNESEIPSLVARIDNITRMRNITKILVVGEPDLALSIYNALIDAGLDQKVQIILVSGRKYEKVKEMFEEMIEHFREIREEYEERRFEIEEMIAEKLSAIGEKCDYWYELSKTVSANITDENAVRRLELIDAAYQRCKDAINQSKPFVALRALEELKHDVRFLIWNYRHENLRNMFRYEIEEELKSPEELREKMMEIEEIVLERFRKRGLVLREECIELVKDFREAVLERDLEEANKIKVKLLKMCKIIPSPLPIEIKTLEILEEEEEFMSPQMPPMAHR